MQEDSDEGGRSISCSRCRQRKQRCHYSSNHSLCDRCLRQGVSCSGLRLSRPSPCQPCIQAKRGCQSVSGSVTCLRCQRSGVKCVRRSRPTTPTSPGSSTNPATVSRCPPPISFLDRADKTFELMTSSYIRYELARQGEQCLLSIGVYAMPCCVRGKYPESEGGLLDKISYHLNMISGLKLVKTVSACGNAMTQPITHWSGNHWNEESPAMSNVQRLGLKSLSSSLWMLIRELGRSRTLWRSTQLVQLTYCLATCMDLRAVAMPDNDKPLYRTIMAFVLIRGAHVLDDESVDESEKRELRECMCQLARYEAMASMKMGVQSAISADIITALHPWPQDAYVWNDSTYDSDPPQSRYQHLSRDTILSTYVRRLHALSRMSTADVMFWLQLRQTSNALSMLFDLYKGGPDRLFLREIYSVELWAMQIGFLRTEDTAEIQCSQTNVDEAIVETLLRMCDRIDQVYNAEQDTLSELYHIFDTVVNNVHLCLIKSTLRRGLLGLPRFSIEILSTCLRVSVYWNAYAKQLADSLEALQDGETEALPPCQRMCTAHESDWE